jgi:hypothetical protein
MITQAEATRVLDAGAVTSGHRLVLICAALAKYAATLETTAGDRLKILEFLEGCVHFNLSAEAIAVVGAASPEFLEIVAEALRLDPPSPEGRLTKSFDVLTSDAVFVRLLQLNPGIVNAIEIKRTRWAA